MSLIVVLNGSLPNLESGSSNFCPKKQAKTVTLQQHTRFIPVLVLGLEDCYKNTQQYPTDTEYCNKSRGR